MQKKIVQIKEINVIEGELNSAPVGVLAFRNDDKIIQKTRTFIYLDKNIYILFAQGEEEFRKIKHGWSTSFLVIRNLNDTEESSSNPYKILSITVTGKIKIIDEQKAFEEISKSFFKKYPGGKGKKNGFSGAVMIDTEEIQAYEESGG
jgi:hypothetical protein